MIGKLALTGCACVVALLLGEAGLRLAGISFPVFETYDAERGFRLRPGKEGWYLNEGRAHLTINRFGYRDRDRALGKPHGTYRIAVLGDSLTEARQVDLRHTYVSRLETALQACPAIGDRAIEILNFGVGGYNTAQQLRTLELDALRFEPDAVLLAFYPGNDVVENSRKLTAGSGGWSINGPVYDLVDGDLVVDEAFKKLDWRPFLYEGIHHSRILEMVNQARRIRQQKGEVQKGDDRSQAAFVVNEIGASTSVFGPPVDPVFAEAWDITERLLGQVAATSENAGARFAVVLMPMPVQVRPDPDYTREVEERLAVADLFYPDRKLTEIGERAGFPVIARTPDLQQAAQAGQIFMHGFPNTAPGVGHLNEAGHKLMVETLADPICAALGENAVIGRR